MALRISLGVRTGAPSSEKPSTPASASSPMAESCSPARPADTAPKARTSTGEPPARAAERMRSRTPGSSSAGWVLGISATVVKPPWAAAAEPVATVSASSKPGSRKWTWRSKKPGATTTPLSVTPAASSPSSQTTDSRTPSVTTISPGPSRPETGSTSQAFSSSKRSTVSPTPGPAEAPAGRAVAEAPPSVVIEPPRRARLRGRAARRRASRPGDTGAPCEPRRRSPPGP